MQKVTRKLAALLAVFVLAVGVFFTATPAMAAGAGTLTVTTTDAAFSGKGVSAWRMFDITVHDNDDGTKSYGYTLCDEWKTFFLGDEESSIDPMVTIEGITEDNVSQKAYEYVNDLTNNQAQTNPSDPNNAGDLADFAKLAAAWAKGAGATSVANVKLADQTFSAGQEGNSYVATFSSIPFGYYVVSPATSGSTDVIDPFRGTDAMLVAVVDGTASLTVKTEYPTVDKQVQNGTGDTADDHASAQIGDTLTFTLTATVPDVSEYDGESDYYRFAFVDTLDDGLTYTNNVVVKIGDQTITADDANYKVTAPTGNEGGDLRIDFGKTIGGKSYRDARDLFKSNAGKTITVTYTAKLNENAVVGEPETNSVKVEYSNNPGTDGFGTSEPSKTYQYDFEFILNKVDEADNPVAGVSFKLKDAEGNYIDLVLVSEGVYRKATESDSNKVQEVTTGSTGKIEFEGLAAGTYYLEETKTPEGYNPIDGDVKIVIADTTNTTTLPVDPSWTVNSDASHEIKVVNKKGTLLPGTGGMGTVIFTVVGVAVIAGGAVWYVNRRRVTANGEHTA